ncbi:hypothetical protein [Nonomuraea sediminis]|uniref:hypothetical protein n=1 Tax=Nonomuraea sediminis TaxID=2835864 RepID=UPI001BDD3700|nr:hypothetical protein [Nonomuraea sediminis]
MVWSRSWSVSTLTHRETAVRRRGLRTDRENVRLRRPLMQALDRMWSRAQAEGTVRPNLTSGDFALLLARVLRPLPNLLEDLRLCVELMADVLSATSDYQRLALIELYEVHAEVVLPQVVAYLRRAGVVERIPLLRTAPYRNRGSAQRA